MGIFSFGFMKALRASERSIGGDITNLDTKIDNLKVKDIDRLAVGKTADGALTEAEVKSGVILAAKTSAQELTLPAATAALKGVVCTIVRTGNASKLTIKVGDNTLNDEAVAIGNVVSVVCTGAAWYVVSKTVGA